MELSVVFADDAVARSLQPRSEQVPEQLELTGVSRGTALAIVLAQYGMGFRPVLTKQGTFVVEVCSGGEADNLWPVGWKTLEPTPDVLPAWLKSIPFSIEDADLTSLLEAVAGKLQIPAYTSVHALAAAGRSLDELTWSRTGKLSPFAMLRTVGEKYELGFDVRADEAGRLFLWATTRQQADAFGKRFAQHSTGEMRCSVQIDLISVDDGAAQHVSAYLRSADGGLSISMRRLYGGLSEGVDVVTVDNGRLRLQLLPTRGMGVWKGELAGIPLQWNSPVQRPVHPSFVDPMRLGGIGWVDGFNELIVRCGLGWHRARGRTAFVMPQEKLCRSHFCRCTVGLPTCRIG
ncbi:MAG UNVERIFIED_CONTAM: aldose 1-epimerase family protein [Planctomycetaceae bacterium]|jgi:hypothetical protein